MSNYIFNTIKLSDHHTTIRGQPYWAHTFTPHQWGHSGGLTHVMFVYNDIHRARSRIAWRTKLFGIHTLISRAGLLGLHPYTLPVGLGCHTDHFEWELLTIVLSLGNLPGLSMLLPCLSTMASTEPDSEAPGTQDCWGSTHQYQGGGPYWASPPYALPVRPG